MNLIQPDDETSLRRMLGIAGELPSDIQHEYALRKVLFDRDATSGRLGTLGLVDLIRYCGKCAPATLKPTGPVNWRNYPHDGSLRVEARFFGDWQPGCFLGFVQAGTLAVRLDNDDFVKECRPDMVRIADDQTPYKAPGQNDLRANYDAPLPPAPESVVVGESDQEADTDVIEDDEVLAAEAALKQAKQLAKETDTVSVSSTPNPSEIDWENMQPGVQVWVNLDDDTLDGKFVAYLGAGRIQVTLDGSESPEEVLACDTYLAG